jgi:tyrosinase
MKLCSEPAKLIIIGTTFVRATAASLPTPDADADTDTPSVKKYKIFRNLKGGPTCTGPIRRRAWRDTPCADQEAYLEAVKTLKQLDPYPKNPHGIPNLDQFSRIHNANKDFAHGTNAFLQWHRWFISRFERALQIVSGSCISLPYWDWEIDSGKEDKSYVLQSSTFGSVDDIVKKGRDKDCVNGGIANYQGFWNTTAWKNDCLKRGFDPSANFIDESNLMQRIIHNQTFEEFGDVEWYPHGVVHFYVG